MSFKYLWGNFVPDVSGFLLHFIQTGATRQKSSCEEKDKIASDFFHSLIFICVNQLDLFFKIFKRISLLKLPAKL